MKHERKSVSPIATALAVLVALVLGAVAATWWHRPAVEPAAPAAATSHGRDTGRLANAGGAAAARAQPVSVGEVQRRDIRVIARAIGTITPANLAVVHVQVSGQLKALHFTEGEPVQVGQLLAEIDPRSYQITLAQAEAQLARDQASLRNARLDLARYRDLEAKQAGPKQQADTQQALVEQLVGTVRADQAAVDSARLQLSYTRVQAPISGLAGLKQADLGNVVNPGDPNGLVSIAQLQPAAVVFAVPDANVARIRQQLAAKVAMRVEAWDRDEKTMLAAGRVDSTDNSIDTSTGTIKVKALFDNADGSLFANQFVNVRLQLDTHTDVLAVPTAALQRGAPGTYVYAVSGDGVVALRPVIAGVVDGDWVEVSENGSTDNAGPPGLQAADRVVTDGADRLRDGAAVEVIDPAKANQARTHPASAKTAHPKPAR